MRKLIIICSIISFICSCSDNYNDYPIIKVTGNNTEIITGEVNGLWETTRDGGVKEYLGICENKNNIALATKVNVEGKDNPLDWKPTIDNFNYEGKIENGIINVKYGWENIPDRSGANYNLTIKDENISNGTFTNALNNKYSFTGKRIRNFIEVIDPKTNKVIKTCSSKL